MSDADRDRMAAGDSLERSVDRRTLLIGTGLTAMAAVSASVAGASTAWVERLLRERFAAEHAAPYRCRYGLLCNQ